MQKDSYIYTVPMTLIPNKLIGVVPKKQGDGILATYSQFCASSAYHDTLCDTLSVTGNTSI